MITRKQWISLASIIVFLAALTISMLTDRPVDEVLGTQQTSPPTAPTTQAAGETAVVKRVVDGDTIELENGQTVRYIGMDTPETKHPIKGKQCYGEQASQRNEELVVGKTVRLEKDVSETDKYGRLLRYVWVDDVLINKELVLEGYAKVSTYPPDVAREEEFTQAQQQARANNRGLWGSCPL